MPKPYRLLPLCLLLAQHLAFAADDEMTNRARAIHERVLALDTHVDIDLTHATSQFLPGNGDAQVNLDKMVAGGLDAAFFIVYVPQTARDETGYLAAKADAFAKFDAIHRMTDNLYADRIGLATTAAEVRALHEQGKLVALIGMENGYVIGRDLSLLEEYRRRGARYLTLVHNGHNDIGDSAQPSMPLGDPRAEHGGLSEFGYEVVDELNRLGILVDVSHVSKDTMMQATRHSKAPVIASHSGAAAVFAHARNMDDEQLLALRDNGGVVQIVAFNTYLKQGGNASVTELVDHIDHAVQLIGVDHVGISSDFGGGGGVSGWNGADETFNVTLELVRRGYSEDDIAKLWGGNVLRILEAAEEVATARE
ncbi:MAG: dipeptidase [Pseudomonadota bacterium]|nr:dipeptidase [Pseudomonadota bacterium]